MYKIIFKWVILSISMAGSCPAGSSAINFEQALLTIKGVEYSIEIARTQQQRRLGLMHRDRLGLRQGMLFVYPGIGEHRIWMKNTRIPLKVIWLDEHQSIIGVKTLYPCKSSPCESYGVSRPSKYIIELNILSGSFIPGDQISGLNPFN